MLKLTRARNKKQDMTAMNDDLVAAVVNRFEQARTKRDAWLDLWQDCYDYTLPEHARFTGVAGVPSRKREQLFDGTAADAVDQLASSLLGHLTPPWVNWFGLTPGLDVPADRSVALGQILDQSTGILQNQIDRSNLMVELHQCFLDLVVGGTAVLQIDTLPPGRMTSFACRAVPLSEVILDSNNGTDLNRVYRRRKITGAILSAMPLAGAMHLYDMASKNPEKTFEIIEFSEQSEQGYQVGSIVLDDGIAPTLIAAQTLSASPFIAFRWMKTPGEFYGRSPVMKTLPDIKTANKVVELILKNASIAVTGIWQAEDDGVLNLANIELVPGAIIPKAVGSAGLKALEMPARFDVSQLVLDDLRSRIRHAMLVDRFAQLDGRHMTATEVMERAAEVGLLLGATYGRLQTELLTPLLTRLYDILRARGEIADLPLDGRSVMLVHRSPLARTQAQSGVQPIMTWLDSLSRLGGGAAGIVNGPAVARELADHLGLPNNFMNQSTNEGV
jgi:hypothetical protein